LDQLQQEGKVPRDALRRHHYTHPQRRSSSESKRRLRSFSQTGEWVDRSRGRLERSRAEKGNKKGKRGGGRFIKFKKKEKGGEWTVVARTAVSKKKEKTLSGKKKVVYDVRKEKKERGGERGGRQTYLAETVFLKEGKRHFERPIEHLGKSQSPQVGYTASKAVTGEERQTRGGEKFFDGGGGKNRAHVKLTSSQHKAHIPDRTDKKESIHRGGKKR